MADVKNGNGNRRILSATNELVAPLAYEINEIVVSVSYTHLGFLLILILVVGIYVAYTGLIKRETTKAIHAVVNFVVVLLSAGAG